MRDETASLLDKTTPRHVSCPKASAASGPKAEWSPVSRSVAPRSLSGEQLFFLLVLAYNIHHVAIAVENLDDAIAAFESQYNVTPISREIVEEQGVEEAMIAIGGSHVQLLEPLSPESPVGRFLSRNGEGMHHIAFAVRDIEGALEHLRSTGARLIDETPRIGGGGHKIAFVHPTELAGTLVELVEVGHG